MQLDKSLNDGGQDRDDLTSGERVRPVEEFVDARSERRFEHGDRFLFLGHAHVEDLGNAWRLDLIEELAEFRQGEAEPGRCLHE
ncbi:hypothetical protein ACFPRL_00670 [Pseudoclavibacter helvolus]